MAGLTMDTKRDVKQQAWAYAHALSGVVFMVVAWLVARAFDSPHPLRHALFAASFCVAAVGLAGTGWRRRRSQEA